MGLNDTDWPKGQGPHRSPLETVNHTVGCRATCCQKLSLWGGGGGGQHVPWWWVIEKGKARSSICEPETALVWVQSSTCSQIFSMVSRMEVFPPSDRHRGLVSKRRFEMELRTQQHVSSGQQDPAR